MFALSPTIQSIFILTTKYFEFAKKCIFASNKGGLESLKFELSLKLEAPELI